MIERPGLVFLYRLCLVLGVEHPDYLGRVLSSRQIAGWEAYNELEPFGPLQEEWRAGLIASTVANFSPISSRRNLTPRDFLPQRRPKTLAERLLALFGGRKPRRVEAS